MVPGLQQWTEEVRPLFSPGAYPALWVTERRSETGPPTSASAPPTTAEAATPKPTKETCQTC